MPELNDEVAASVSENPDRTCGAIRRLLADKGCGFIAGDDGQDYFFHWTAMAVEAKDFRELKLRERVSFNKARSPRGIRAVEVRVI